MKLTVLGGAGARALRDDPATDLLIAKATYIDRVPDDSAGTLNSAVGAGEQARQARAERLVLTHLAPGTDPVASRNAASRAYQDWIGVATAGFVLDLGG